MSDETGCPETDASFRLSPYAAGTRILFEITAAIGIATGLCLLVWQMTRPWRLAVLGFFIFISCPLHWGGVALFLDFGLFAWGLLCFLESGPRLRIYSPALTILTAVAALTKFTFLLTGSFTLGLLACDLVLRRRPVLAMGMIFGFLLAFLLGWLALGQSLSGLGAYLSNSCAVADGYNQAMGYSFVSLGWIVVMMFAALAAVLIRSLALQVAGTGPTAVRRATLAFWLAGLLFVEWKYGCVRSDWDHVASTLGIVTITAMCLDALPAAGQRAVFWSRAAISLCLIAALAFIHREVHGFALAKCVKQTCLDMTASLGVLVQPADFLREKTEAFHAEQKKNQLPATRSTVGGATIDIFGQNQALAILNEFNYQPRPAFQNYTAYSRPIMELNEQFYLSKNAPEYVLFNLQAIDARFPALEDSLLLRDLLANYGPVIREGGYLLLRRKSATPVQMTLLKEGNIGPGEKIDLPSQGSADLWLEIELYPTLFGRLRQFLYKPSDTQLAVWSSADPATPARYHAPATMLSAGFLASPLILNTGDVLGLYTGAKVPRCEAFSVELAPGILRDWQPRIHFRMYRIEK